jgi:hypothetical protein
VRARRRGGHDGALGHYLVCLGVAQPLHVLE